MVLHTLAIRLTLFFSQSLELEDRSADCSKSICNLMAQNKAEKIC